MKLRMTDSARWQIRSALEALLKRDRGSAIAFREEIAGLLFDPDALASRSGPLPDFPELPIRQTVVSDYRLFV